jgi:ribosomal protein S18 acetylase RimI-like enzyme
MIILSVLDEATESAYNDISTLLSQLHAESNSVYAPEFARLQSIVSDPNSHMIVAREGEKIVGMATLYILVHVDEVSGCVDDVVVDSAYRGQGIGRSLMEKVLSVAREKNLLELDLTSRPSRVAGNHLYQKLGFEKRETNVYRLKL